MKTYNDFEKVKDTEQFKQAFMLSAITEYKSSDMYRNGLLGYNYFMNKNTTILMYQKFIYDVTGEVLPDDISANHKCVSSFFKRFIKIESSYLLGNGVSFKNEQTKEKLGGYKFDRVLIRAAIKSLWGGVSYGFFNFDHVHVFSVLEFVPLVDEEDGMIKAGIRFWQIADDKPMRITLFEMDGFTEYLFKNGELTIMKEKHTYVQAQDVSEVYTGELYDLRNYPSFPIVPLWCNDEKQSQIVDLRNDIDSYDLVKSGLVNDIDEASHVYWIIKNAGGMSDYDVVKFLKNLKEHKAAKVDEGEGSTAESHTINVPYEARTVALDRLSADLYKDAMILDTKNIYGGNITATAIQAAYDDMNRKVTEFETCVTEFIEGLLYLVGVENEAPSYTYDPVVNKSEEITTLIQSAEYLSRQYITRKVLTYYGDVDQLDTVEKEILEEETSRMALEENLEGGSSLALGNEGGQE